MLPDISWMTIFKIVISGALSYILFPFLLVIRDLIFHKIIDKWILTESLTIFIKMCESDRWYLNNKFNKPRGFTINHSGIMTYTIDGKEVTKDQYLDYDKNFNFHHKRFILNDSRIIRKHNLITLLIHNYKQVKGLNPIPELRQQYYENQNLAND